MRRTSRTRPRAPGRRARGGGGHQDLSAHSSRRARQRRSMRADVRWHCPWQNTERSVVVRGVARRRRILLIRHKDEIIVIDVVLGAAHGAAVAIVVAERHHGVLLLRAARELLLDLLAVAGEAGDAYVSML